MKYLIIFLSLSITLFSCKDNKEKASEGKEQTTTNTFQNPILAGFYPDPSICKAGDKFYLTNSSFAYFPGLPIFESDDLVNWKQIGHAMDRKEQLDTQGERITRGLFAPAISFHDGTFYLVCTRVDKGGNFIITAKNPAGPWSNPTYIPEVNGIDPSLFFDGDKAYIIYNSIPPNNESLYGGHRTIRMYELDKESLKVKGEEILLINGGTDIEKKPVWIEGPHIYKIDDYYYLMCAEGGTAYNHSEVIFRSKNVAGPYEAWSENPILTQRHLDPNRANPITTAGHADIVQMDNGDWWAVFLACRPYEGNYFNIGRETFLAPVKWKDGWPIINPDYEEVQYTYPTPTGEAKDQASFPLNGNFTMHDDFVEEELGMNYLFMRTPQTKWYDIKEGQLVFQIQPETASGLSNTSFVGHRQQHLKGTASLQVNFNAKNSQEKAGLLAFQSRTNYYFLAKTMKDSQPVVELYQSAEDSLKVLASTPVSEKATMLKVAFDGAKYSFAYAEKEGEWTTLKDNVDGKFLSTEVAGGFVGTIIGMYATSSGNETDNTAAFDWFEYQGNDLTYEEGFKNQNTEKEAN
ncbi:glycoside hydrolase family 43 protein [Fulvivirga sediminis]|uniref:Glycoside hydrolase family 43 protein n=1 Tax=Fulvivirga sediminis TaxID=2803949 RepID=A0A937F9T3_9BACT|nr:glycoside hydrolase family 43 protein [Fulvivirga sediminis]MBL3658941.1 glycoside hydrolase family 43 protein [Fulvivirga sediminis]